METQAATVFTPGSVPRLRVTRRNSSAASSTLPAVELTTDLEQPLSYSDSQTASEDESGTLDPTHAVSRLLSASLPPPDSPEESSNTVHRLRAILDRFDTPARTPVSASRGVMPPSPSEPESDFDVRPAQAARASIKSLFQNALREPGDTPEKPKLTRRASFNAVGSPKVSKSRRKSTSDEESEALTKHPDRRRTDFSTAASFDRLRLQLTESMTATSASSSIGHPPTDVNVSIPKRATPYQHRVSKVPVTSSPARHSKSHHDLEPFEAISTGADSAVFLSQDFDHSSRVQGERYPPHSLHPDAPASVMHHRDHDTVPQPSTRTSSNQSGSDYRDRLRAFQQETDIERERDWNRRNPPPRPARTPIPSDHPHSKMSGRVSPGVWPTPPPPGTSPSTARSPRHSLTRHDRDMMDGHTDEGDSSRDTSVSSKLEYRQRLEDAEREHQHELERNWNRRHLQHSQGEPHSHAEDFHAHRHPTLPVPSAEHPRPRSRAGNDTMRNPSPSHPDQELNERREIEHERERNWDVLRPKLGQHSHHSSGTGHHHSPRAPSPLPSHAGHSASSVVSYPPHQGEENEEMHERERNWNAPRPKWGHHAHHQAAEHEPERHMPRSAYSHPLGHTTDDKERERSWDGHRPNSLLGVPDDGPNPRSASPTSSRRGSLISRNSSRAKSPAPAAGHDPGPRSPHPSRIGEKGKEDAELSHEMAWNLPNISSSQRHEVSISSSSPMSDSRASNPTPLLQTVSATHASRQRSASLESSFAKDDIKKGHRRTITELSEPTGPFPRKSTLPLSLETSQEESDDSLFADESVPPPQMSTPTFRQRHLPDLSLSPAASDIPLPPSPPSPSQPATRADSDLARLQRAVAPNLIFPAQQPSPVTAKTSTPPARPSNTKTIEFRTPSPPGVPDLPDPPSSDEGAKIKTPTKPDEQRELSATYMSTMKTPRFPGAFGTPAPPQSVSINGYSMEGEVSTGSDEVETTPKLGPVDATAQPQVQGNDIINGMSQPAAVPDTPALPGAYRATPTPSKRKGILKVRFDGDVQNPALVNGTKNAVNGVVSATKVISPPPSPSSEDIPLLSLSPSPRKGLRLVDEYGRARRFTEDGEEIILDSRRKGSPTRATPARPRSMDDMKMTPRRRAKMRQVDALGNIITEKGKPGNGEARETRIRRKEVVSRLTRSLEELKDDLREQEEALAASMPQGGPRGNERLMDLAVVSKTARVERNKLARKLQLERQAESDATLSPALLPSEPLSRTSWWRRKWKLMLCLLILELIVLCVGYRLASMHAKQAWLATYFDPFFPALYLRKTPPSFTNSFSTLPAGWSAFAISGAVRQVGIRGFVEGVGKQLWEGMWSWRMEPWEAWGSPAAGPPVPQPWPPS